MKYKLKSLLRKLRLLLIYNDNFSIFKPLILWVYRIFYVPLIRKKEDAFLEFVVSKNKKIVFVLNPKVASRSFISYLTKNINDAMVIDSNLSSIHSSFPSKKYSYYTISRNPVSRTKSCYTQKIQNKDEIISARIISRFKTLGSVSSFEEYVKWLVTEDGSDKHADRHWKSQHKLLFLDKDCFQPNYKRIGKIEKLDDFISLISSDLKISEDMPRLLVTSTGDQEEISEEIKQTVNLRYKRDFEIFNY